MDFTQSRLYAKAMARAEDEVSESDPDATDEERSLWVEMRADQICDAVVCRSGKSAKCMHKRSNGRVADEPWWDDSTFDGVSIVCDACYIALGCPGVPVDSPRAANFPVALEQKTPRAISLSLWAASEAV